MGEIGVFDGSKQRNFPVIQGLPGSSEVMERYNQRALTLLCGIYTNVSDLKFEHGFEWEGRPVLSSRCYATTTANPPPQTSLFAALTSQQTSLSCNGTQEALSPSLTSLRPHGIPPRAEIYAKTRGTKSKLERGVDRVNCGSPTLFCIYPQAHAVGKRPFGQSPLLPRRIHSPRTPPLFDDVPGPYAHALRDSVWSSDADGGDARTRLLCNPVLRAPGLSHPPTPTTPPRLTPLHTASAAHRAGVLIGGATAHPAACPVDTPAPDPALHPRHGRVWVRVVYGFVRSPPYIVGWLQRAAWPMKRRNTAVSRQWKMCGVG
ncbi:hypothetical protein C8F04DRAFT_1234363 [Mycena alexandri]|uniref:Uncharacterized protein n=1 Tax=Mycena alexandri TaxID=1745969 RepID=A0AAD6X6U4_9AGAR|nr:hypothetical protein C8F04DRAFT_1234363 [Mycena alexandri]